MLGLTELLELLLRRARCSPGSVGCSPVDLAKMFSTSVNEITPLSRPEMRAPAMAEAGTLACATGDCGAALAGGTAVAGPSSGVAGAEGEGEADSTTHMR